MTKTASLLRVAQAYAAALAVAVLWLALGPTSDHLWLDALIADLLATLVIFGFSRVHKNSSFYDAYWSVVPPLLLFYWWSQSDGVDPVRCWLVAVVVLLWSVRLTANWAYAWPGLHHEDWRYPLLRERAGRFDVVADLFAIHVIPTIQVFLGCLPMYVALTRSGRDVGIIDVIAVLVGVGAVALEMVSDLQMHRFVRDRQPGQVMDQGVWSWSRHPNYFGELMFWSSLALFGSAAAPSDAWWLFIGVVAMLAMFLGASIPMMEERSLQRRSHYQEVINRVPMLVPRPPGRTRG